MIIENIKSEIQCDTMRKDLLPVTVTGLSAVYHMNVQRARSPSSTFYSDTVYNVHFLFHILQFTTFQREFQVYNNQYCHFELSDLQAVKHNKKC